MKFLRRYWPHLMLVGVLLLGTLAWSNRDDIQDWAILRNYKAPTAIEQLATDTAMSPYGERLFYVNKPTLDDKTALNQNCEGLFEEEAVLGCFRGDRQGIHIYDITDPRLHGVEQVTAAHEMLHQAYERLSGSEKERVEAMLQNYYQTMLTDESVKSKIEIYKKTAGDELLNEIHSMLGSEIKELPAELEEYYKQYFNDRQKVVAFRAQSQAEFDKYRAQIAAYDARLDQLKPMLEQDETTLTAEKAELKQLKAEMDSDLAAGRIAEYNAAVGPYNAKVKAYNSDLAAANKRVKEYNQIVNERNAIAIQVKSLNQALDSHLTPQ